MQRFRRWRLMLPSKPASRAALRFFNRLVTVRESRIRGMEVRPRRVLAPHREAHVETTQKAEKHQEGPVARSIEDQTAQIPSDVFLWAAMGAMGVSLSMQAMGRKHSSLFVGQWVPVFLMFGLYNKIVKVAGSDQFDNGTFDQGDH